MLDFRDVCIPYCIQKINIEAVESVSWGMFRVNFTTLEEILNHLRIYKTSCDKLPMNWCRISETPWNMIHHSIVKLIVDIKYKSNTQLKNQFTATTGNLIFH